MSMGETAPHRRKLGESNPCPGAGHTRNSAAAAGTKATRVLHSLILPRLLEGIEVCASSGQHPDTRSANWMATQPHTHTHTQDHKQATVDTSGVARCSADRMPRHPDQTRQRAISGACLSTACADTQTRRSEGTRACMLACAHKPPLHTTPTVISGTGARCAADARVA